MATGGEGIRFSVELVRTGGGGVTGSVSSDEWGVATPFSGWLELLALLETPPIEGDGRNGDMSR